VNVIGYFHGVDPAAGLLVDGELVAFVEEERLLRVKHASGWFPIRSIDYCLDVAGLTIGDIDFMAYGWNAPAYSDGIMKDFYERVNAVHPPNDATRSWQARNLSWFSEQSLAGRLRRELVHHYGTADVPPLLFYPHHRSHAVTAYHFSPFDEALVLTIDGSGDQHTTTLWAGRGSTLEPLWEARIPDSLGWFYAAITEFLGFEAYDGEYKVMGLAAYGQPDARLNAALRSFVRPGTEGFDFVVDPRFVHHGQHSYSDRFTDELADLLGMAPRAKSDPLEAIHESLAFEAQALLEETVLRLVRHFLAETGLSRLCLAGGVALNVKMNSRLRELPELDDVFVFPMPSDSSAGLGAAAGIWQERTGRRVAPLRTALLGPEFSDDEIQAVLRSCGLEFRVSEDVAEDAARLLADGKVVAWFQGRLEAGPRALGSRSILADPRVVESRDRVNGAIKFREYWRPFCPSMTAEAASRYLRNSIEAPYMIMAFDSTQEALDEVPAVVHVDGTVRVQVVDPDVNPRYFQLLQAFERIAGVAVVLNTSFNVKGEAIVASPRDAIRTFSATGIDALAIGNCIVEKTRVPESAP
jgi:carbamoyltransferase